MSKFSKSSMKIARKHLCSIIGKIVYRAIWSKLNFTFSKEMIWNENAKKKHENEVSGFDETLTFLYESRKCVGIKWQFLEALKFW